MKRINNLTIIGEIGVNHNGNINIAKKIIKNLKNSDLDLIKIQTYKTDNLIQKNTKLANYQKENIKTYSNQYDLLKKYELKFSEIEYLKEFIEKQNKNFLSSVFDVESLKFIYDLGCKIIKIPSSEMNNLQLLSLAAKMKLSLIISTGMANLKEIKNIYRFLRSQNLSDKKISFLHCVSDYPTNINDLNLKFITNLRNKFPNNIIGFSDHSLSEHSSMIAITQGAQIIEKHLTLDRFMDGPDHKASLEIKNLDKFILNIRNVSLMLGKFNKFLNTEEKLNSRLVKKSIYAKRLIKKGEIFSENNLILKRPMSGISADYWFKILGKKSKKFFLANEPIKKI